MRGTGRGERVALNRRLEDRGAAAAISAANSVPVKSVNVLS